jgi:hypothetical protein
MAHEGWHVAVNVKPWKFLCRIFHANNFRMTAAVPRLTFSSPDGVTMQNGRITMLDLPGIGFAGRAGLDKGTQELSASDRSDSRFSGAS